MAVDADSKSIDSNPFLLIGFTSPYEWSSAEEEAHAIVKYLGVLDFFHIRKKDASEGYTRSLMTHIPKRYHRCLVLHSHYDLKNLFDFGGIHNVDTASCHSLREIKASGNCRYSFLSPIFDSISKPGYLCKFDLEDDELRNQLIQSRIIALGGVKPEFFPKLIEAKFAGAALLGYLWSPKENLDEKIRVLLNAKETN